MDKERSLKALQEKAAENEHLKQEVHSLKQQLEEKVRALEEVNVELTKDKGDQEATKDLLEWYKIQFETSQKYIHDLVAR